MEREHCALRSRELGERLAGSAPLATGWIAVEHAGPWTPNAPSTTELGPLVDHLAHEGVRLQLLRRVRARHAPVPHPDGHTVLLAHAAVDPAARWLERLDVADPADLADLDPSVVLSPAAPGLGEPVDHDVWLVCAHGRRDACCAVRGRPVAAALTATGAEVWETTHTGGHRFAATAVVLPDGLSLGRLDTVDPVATAADLAAGSVPGELVRGRSALPRPAQAAEVELRRRLGVTARDGVRVEGHHAGVPPQSSPHAAATVVHLTVGAERWSAEVASAPTTPPRPVSDGAEPTQPDEHLVTRLTRASTPPLGPPAGSMVWIDETTYPATRHRRFAATVLGADEQGTWLGVPAGTVARRGDDPSWTLGGAFVVLVPHDDPWLVECHADHPGVATSVTIGTRPRWQGDRVTHLTLDTDVVCTHDGTVRVQSRDVLDERRRTLPYPARLVARAETAARRAAALLSADPEHFGATPWLARLATTGHA